jgi:4-amino-4-deoxy-L-arabinose transferase-like glycosyltransferase
MKEAAMGWLKRQVEAGRGVWLALAVMLACGLPGLFEMPPLDRDEVLFSQASRQMAASGDYIDIRFGEAPRYKKPVGIYWLQVAAAKVTGAPGEIWSYRLVSLLAALVSVAATHAIGRRFLGPEGALLAAVALAASVMLGIEAHLAKTDATLLATVAVAMVVVARATQERVGRWIWGFWAAIGVSLLVKGPLGPMVVVLAVAALCGARRDLEVLRRLWSPWGLLLAAGIAVPWYLAISLVSQGEFWAASLGKDMLGKVAMAQESHGAPPGSYLLALWLTFWPGSIILAAGLPALWAGRRHPAAVFALAWAVPTFLVFEFTPTKLIHYTLPAWPALALLMAAGVQAGGRYRRILGVLPAVLAPLALGALGLALGRLGAEMPWGFWAGIGVMAVAAVFVLRGAGQLLPLALSLALGGIAFNTAFFPAIARTPMLWPAPALARIAADHPDCAFTVAGFSEPSIVFATDGRVRLAEAEALPALLSAPGCQLIAAPDLATDRPEIARVEGIDLGSGRRISLGLWLNRP